MADPTYAEPVLCYGTTDKWLGWCEHCGRDQSGAAAPAAPLFNTPPTGEKSDAQAWSDHHNQLVHRDGRPGPRSNP